MADTQKPSWAVDEAEHVVPQTPGSTPPENSIFISSGFGMDPQATLSLLLSSTILSATNVIGIRVINVSARYDPPTDKLWVCVETLITTNERKASRKWMAFDDYMASDTPRWKWMEPMDQWTIQGGGNRCYDGTGSDMLLNKDKIVALWKEQGFEVLEDSEWETMSESDAEFSIIPNDYRFYRLLDRDKEEFRLLLLEPGPPSADLSCILIHCSRQNLHKTTDVDSDSFLAKLNSKLERCTEDTLTFEERWLHSFKEVINEGTPTDLLIAGRMGRQAMAFEKERGVDDPGVKWGHLGYVDCYDVSDALSGKYPYSYECLSYCWGDATDTTTIRLRHPVRRDSSDSNLTQMHLEEQQFFITRNLETALLHLRHTTYPRLMWIDAICIRQDDFEERAHQVACMGKIYSEAALVTAWLGETDFSGDAIMLVAKTWSNLMEKQELLKLQSMESTLAILRESGLPRMENADAEAFIETLGLFFSRPWFYRVWVLQEVFNAPRVVVCCGDHVADWDTIRMLNLLRQDYIHSEEGGKLPFQEKGVPAPLPTIWMRLSFEPQQKLSFLDLLNGTTEFEASNQRDHLYALYGMAKEICDVACLPEELQPDYLKSPEEVEANFTRWLINNTRSLDILSFVRLNKTLDGYPLKKLEPTWLPYCLGMGGLGFRLPECHQSAGISQALVGDQMQWNELSLLGCRFDIVGSVCKLNLNISWDKRLLIWASNKHVGLLRGIPMVWWSVRCAMRLKGKNFVLDIGNSNPDELETELEPFIDTSYTPYPSGCDLFEAFFFTLFGFWPDGDAQPWEATYDHINHRLPKEDDTIAASFAAAWSQFNPTMDWLPKHLHDRFRCLSTWGKASLMPTVFATISTQYFFFTPEGYIGLGPRDVKPGDLLVILYGGRVPFILRPKDTRQSGGPRYKFIGSCYIHGRMDGSVVEEYNQARVPDEMFVLI